MVRAWVFALACAGWLVPAVVVAGGKLERVRSEVRGTPPKSSSHSRPTQQTSTTQRVTSTRRVVYTYPIRGRPVSPPTSQPCCGTSAPALDLTERAPPQRTIASYADYPYADGNPYYVRRLPRSDAADRDLWAGTAQAEGGYAGEGVWRMGGAVALRLWRFGLDGDLHYFLDQKLTDAIYLGSINATFAIVLQPSFVLRVGPGVNAMIDGRTPGQGHREYAAGFNATTTMDIIPKKPVIISGRFDYGTLWKAHTMTVRGTVGWIITRWELYAGYHYQRIGAVPLSGPVVGVRAWF
jgi:hypothetical protein